MSPTGKVIVHFFWKVNRSFREDTKLGSSQDALGFNFSSALIMLERVETMLVRNNGKNWDALAGKRERLGRKVNNFNYLNGSCAQKKCTVDLCVPGTTRAKWICVAGRKTSAEYNMN